MMYSIVKRKRIYGISLLSLAASSVGLAIPVMAQGSGDASAELGRSYGDVEEIVITANRREERNQDVPIAITAFSPGRLAKQGISKVEDLIAKVPSITVGTAGSGSRDAQTITLRGQGAAFQASPGVIIYMNEVPLPSATSLTQQGGPGNFLDLESLQVLAGPQGTLFGRNATGGAILLVPRKPQNDFNGYVQAGYGNHNNVELEGVVNVPLIEDKLLVRAAGQYRDRDGYTRDVTFNKNRDDLHYYTGRVGIMFKPTESFENYLMLYGTKSRNNGAGNIHNRFNIAGLKGVGFCVDAPTVPSGIAVSCDVYRAATEKADKLGPRATALGLDAYQTVKTWGAINTSELELTEQVSLRNIFSYQRLKVGYLYDGDATPFQQFDVGVPQERLPGAYENGVPYNFPRDNVRLITEELQVQGTFFQDKLLLTAGGFYSDQRPNGTQASSQINYCPASLTGNPQACAPQRSFYGAKTESKALYAQANINLGLLAPALQGLKLTLGGRHTWDSINGFARTFTPRGPLFRCASTAADVANSEDCTISGNLNSKEFTWLAGLDYKINDDALLYGKISRGYKAGGFNTSSVRESTRTFAPEFVTSYEMGVKSNWKVGSIRGHLNVAAYHLKYSNIQRAAADFNISTLASGAQILSSGAEISGIEAVAGIRPTKNIQINATYSHTDADYKNYTFIPTAPVKDCSGMVIPSGQIANSSCLPFQYVAPHTFSVSADYQRDLPENLGNIGVFVSYSYTAAQYTEAFLLPEVQPDSYFKAFGLVNASVTWSGVGGSNFDITAFVNNATNKLYQINNTHVFQAGSLLSSAALYGEPRMYGFRVRYKFGN